MKTIKNKKQKSNVQKLREIRDKIGIDIQDMSYEQLMKYVEKRLKPHSKQIAKHI